MQCNNPITISFRKNPIVHAKYPQGLTVPCGKCTACRISKAREWSMRILHEIDVWEKSIFVTLTYNDEYLPKFRSVNKIELQKFFKRLRKNLGRKIKYFLGAEYGELHTRPHYHCILFGVSRAEQLQIDQSWGLGYVHVGDVSHDSARYVASYTLKKLSGPQVAEYVRKGIKPEFSLMSRCPGIGYRYVESNKKFLNQNGFVIVKGNKAALPRYYSDKVYTEAEKTLLHSTRQEFYDERHQRLKDLSGSIHGYQVNDYERGIRAQHIADLKAKEALKRRKL